MMRRRIWLLFNPGEPGSGGSPAPAATPAPAPTGGDPSGSATPPTPSPAPAPAGTAGTAGTPPPAPAPEPTVRDVLAGYGYQQAGQFQNDHQALQHLVSQARLAEERAQLAQYGQQYVQHAPEFQTWLQQRQQQQAQQQAQQQSWWKAPEYNPQWQQQIYRDPQTGELKAAPGAPYDTIQKYTAWTNHQQQFLNNFSRDPISAIQPGIEQVVQQVAGRMVQQALQQQAEQQQAQQFISQHGEWLHARDGQGQVLMDPRTQRPALSPLGRTFAGYVFEAEKMGLQDSQSQQKYALGMLQRDYLVQQYKTGATTPATPAAPPPSPNDAARQQFLANAAQQQQQNPGQQLGNTNGQYQPPQGAGVRGLMELMTREFAANGIQAGQQLV